jgi:hypothetical protein
MLHSVGVLRHAVVEALRVLSIMPPKPGMVLKVCCHCNSLYCCGTLLPTIHHAGATFTKSSSNDLVQRMDQESEINGS